MADQENTVPQEQPRQQQQRRYPNGNNHSNSDRNQTRSNDCENDNNIRRRQNRTNDNVRQSNEGDGHPQPSRNSGRDTRGGHAGRGNGRGRSGGGGGGGNSDGNRPTNRDRSSQRGNTRGNYNRASNGHPRRTGPPSLQVHQDDPEAVAVSTRVQRDPLSRRVARILNDEPPEKSRLAQLSKSEICLQEESVVVVNIAPRSTVVVSKQKYENDLALMTHLKMTREPKQEKMDEEIEKAISTLKLGESELEGLNCALCREVKNCSKDDNRFYVQFECDHQFCMLCGIKYIHSHVGAVLNCPHCRGEVNSVIITRNLQVQKHCLQNLNISTAPVVLADDPNLVNDLRRLLGWKCTQCDDYDERFSLFRDSEAFEKFNKHLFSCANRIMCYSCYKSLALLPFEMITYTLEDLYAHILNGSPVGDSRLLRHEFCFLCAKSDIFHSVEELFSHSHRAHFFCRFCERDELNHEFYGLPAGISKHYIENHFVCRPCLEERDFQDTYGTEQDLKMHVLEEHRNKPYCREDYLIPAFLEDLERQERKGRANATEKRTSDESSHREIADRIDQELRQQFNRGIRDNPELLRVNEESFISHFPSLPGAAGAKNASNVFVFGFRNATPKEDEFPGLPTPPSHTNLRQSSSRGGSSNPFSIASVSARGIPSTSNFVLKASKPAKRIPERQQQLQKPTASRKAKKKFIDPNDSDEESSGGVASANYGELPAELQFKKGFAYGGSAGSSSIVHSEAPRQLKFIEAKEPVVHHTAYRQPNSMVAEEDFPTLAKESTSSNAFNHPGVSFSKAIKTEPKPEVKEKPKQPKPKRMNLNGSEFPTLNKPDPPLSVSAIGGPGVWSHQPHTIKSTAGSYQIGLKKSHKAPLSSKKPTPKASQQAPSTSTLSSVDKEFSAYLFPADYDLRIKKFYLKVFHRYRQEHGADLNSKDLQWIAKRKGLSTQAAIVDFYSQFTSKFGPRVMDDVMPDYIALVTNLTMQHRLYDYFKQQGSGFKTVGRTEAPAKDRLKACTACGQLILSKDEVNHRRLHETDLATLARNAQMFKTSAIKLPEILEYIGANIDKEVINVGRKK